MNFRALTQILISATTFLLVSCSSEFDGSYSGNVNGKKIIVSGKLEGNIHADKIALKKDCDVKGVLSQKVLSIEEGANLKIKTETYE